jgi:hypothetical protein
MRPARYDGSKPACVMVFQAGGASSATGQWREPAVFDNLIQREGMPVTIAIFVDLTAEAPNQQGRVEAFMLPPSRPSTGMKCAATK